MPVYIGDYLADTMHLSTEQHGAYLLLLFHLWRRGILQDDDVVLAQITGLSVRAWSASRAVLAEFFEIREGQWHHGRVEREKSRTAAKQKFNASRAKLGASSRWGKPLPLLEDAESLPASNASSILNGMLDDAKSQPQPQLLKTLPCSRSVRGKGDVDQRHVPFRLLLGEYWRAKNHASPEMPWQGRDAKALSDFLAASPHLNETQFCTMLNNRAKSAVAHGDRVFLWIANLTRFQEEITVYNKPASAGGGNASRAEIIATASSAPLTEHWPWLENALIALGKLALSKQLSLTPECLLLMAEDLRDVPWRYLEMAITDGDRALCGWESRSRWTASRRCVNCACKPNFCGWRVRR